MDEFTSYISPLLEAATTKIEAIQARDWCSNILIKSKKCVARELASTTGRIVFANKYISTNMIDLHYDFLNSDGKLLGGCVLEIRDGGNVELVDVSDNTVKLKLIGACAGCPMSTMTLKMGIERILKQEIPEVKEVVAV